MSKFKKGHKGFWKGKKLSEGHKTKIGEANKGRKSIKYWLGKKRLDMIGNKNPAKKQGIGKKISEAKKGWNGLIGHKHSEGAKKKMREAKINNPNRIFKDTSIELKIEAELQRRNINYQKQVPLCKIAIVDFYLPEYRIVIQADGDYWHNLPGRKEKDERQDKVLIFNGFNVYRFWEHEINESVKNCINNLILKYD